MRLFAMVAAFLALAPAPAEAALKAYLFLVANGVDLQCESTLAGRENAIEAYTFSGHVFRQVAGQSLGPVEHRPLRFTHRVSKCTPLLYKALVLGETITGTIRFYETAAGGQEQNVFTVEISDARIASISPALPDTLDASTASLPNLEAVSIVYGHIQWTWNNGGITFQTDP